MFRVKVPHRHRQGSWRARHGAAVDFQLLLQGRRFRRRRSAPGATVVAADPTSPPAVANDAETADAPEIETRKRKRESGDEGTARDETPGTGTPGRSDDHGVSATGASVSPETCAEILAVTAERDPRRRDAMRERLGENAVGSSESKRREVRERFKWLDAKHVVDDKGRHPSHEDYDGNTVRVPSHLKLSASQKQYWDVKSKFRDVVLFFKGLASSTSCTRTTRRSAACAALDWKMTVSGVGHCRQVGCPESGVARRLRRARGAGQAGADRADVRRRRSQGADGEQNGGDSEGSCWRLRRRPPPWTARLEPRGPVGRSTRAPHGDRPLGDRRARRRDAKASATVGFAFLDAAAGVAGRDLPTTRAPSCGSQSPPALSTLLTQILPVGGARAPRLARPNGGGAREGGSRRRRPERRAARHERRERRRRGRTRGIFFPARARATRGAAIPSRAFAGPRRENNETRATKIRKATKATKAGTKAFSRLSRRSARRRGARWPRSRRT